jgi:phage gp46-like protein
MSGVSLNLQPDGSYDLKISNGALDTDAGLETAVLLSLFSDRRVSEEELPDLAESKRGYWGDMVADVEGDRFGSKLWTLARAKRVPETLRLGEDYAREALLWLVEDGIASDIFVTADFDGEISAGRWKLIIKIEKPSGAESRFEVLWNEQKIKRG